MSKVKLSVPANSVVLANKLLNSLDEDNLLRAGFSDGDIGEFGAFFLAVREAAEEIEVDGVILNGE